VKISRSWKFPAASAAIPRERLRRRSVDPTQLKQSGISRKFPQPALTPSPRLPAGPCRPG
jgi:hypothetical protein